MPITQTSVSEQPARSQRISLGELDSSASFLLRIAQLASYEAVFALDPHMPLSLPEQTLLIVIEENPDAKQGAIADVLRIKWSHMTKLVSKLEARGLVERFVPAHDRRSVRLRLTQAGRKMLDQMKPRIHARDASAMSMLSETEQRQLVRLLRKVAGWPALPEPEPEAMATIA